MMLRRYQRRMRRWRPAKGIIWVDRGTGRCWVNMGCSLTPHWIGIPHDLAEYVEGH